MKTQLILFYKFLELLYRTQFLIDFAYSVLDWKSLLFELQPRLIH